MNRHALDVLEFPEVLALVAARASSALGAARVMASAPSNDAAWIAREHELVGATRALMAGADGWRPEPVPDVGAALGRLRAEGSVLNAEELRGIATLLRSSRLTCDALAPTRRRGAAAIERGGGSTVLTPLASTLVSAKPPESAIALAIGDDLQLTDAASPALRRLRRERASRQAELVKLLEKMLAHLDPHVRVADMSVTVRNGRYVIPVRREGKSAIGGIVHDESATRGTVFIEPPAAVELGNRVRELEGEEQREIDRLLAELSDLVRPLREALVASLETLIVLDTLTARARFADEFACVPAALTPARTGFVIRGGRHPLLAARAGAVVPFDLEMPAEERTLLLSGPNTGGKTVLLKALGLIAAMAQAGIPPTVGAESRVPLFDDCFADIGDEQSIAASLSTFSAHLRNLGEILTRATADSLALIDELGSGTDPAEGAALGAAVLERLTDRGGITVATTHLGALKLLATEHRGIVNASLQFDEERLEPTYRFLKGVPGRSYGLGIARRLALPDDVLARAESRLSRGERGLETLLADLERRTAELETKERDTADAHERATARIADVTARERAAREAERSLERRAREEARTLLLDARREVERVVHDLRTAEVSEETARLARRRLEEAAAELRTADDADDADRSAGAEGADEAFVPGDLVTVGSLAGREGKVVSVRDEEVVVSVGTVKLRVPARTLRRTSRRPLSVPRSPFPVPSALPDEVVAPEVDLRGMRVDEMERALIAAVDAAVRADLKSLRVIHGKGTGALRERAGELLRGDPRVASVRLGAWNEGGAGVTVAELR